MNAVVKCARDWIGTPYRHQASVKGSGADCLGLIRGVWRELYGCEPEPTPHYSRDWSEPQRDEVLWKAARRHMIAVDKAPFMIGSVVLFRMRDAHVAKHLGIVSDVGAEPRFIHSYDQHGVVESPFGVPWQRRVVAQFKFPKGDV